MIRISRSAALFFGLIKILWQCLRLLHSLFLGVRNDASMAVFAREARPKQSIIPFNPISFTVPFFFPCPETSSQPIIKTCYALRCSSHSLIHRYNYSQMNSYSFAQSCKCSCGTCICACWNDDLEKRSNYSFWRSSYSVGRNCRCLWATCKCR